jgi:hypothetical protein
MLSGNKGVLTTLEGKVSQRLVLDSAGREQAQRQRFIFES